MQALQVSRKELASVSTKRRSQMTLQEATMRMPVQQSELGFRKDVRPPHLAACFNFHREASLIRPLDVLTGVIPQPKKRPQLGGAGAEV